MDWNELKKSIPDDGFAEKYEIYRRARPTVTLVVLRTVTDPILFRSTDSERAETQEFNSTIHAQVNGEKFVSKERLTGLNLCRELDEKENIISAEYTYNEPIPSLPKSQTADLLTYGLAGTVSGATFSQKSRVIEGYTYSLEPYDLMNKETHNALFESGTMRDEAGGQSEALFNPVKVQPGTHFVHFITLEAGTREMFLYLIHNILNTGRYGARETRTGRNMKNEIIGLITSESDSSLSCGELICDHIKDVKNELSRSAIQAAISAYIEEHKRADWKIYHAKDFKLDEGSEFPQWILDSIEVGSRLKKEQSLVLKNVLEILRAQGLEIVNKKPDDKTTQVPNNSNPLKK
ncbi:type I-D CRISPR-associated protein Cas7/Csc2 [Candidatus Methanoperedens nitratireducens]|uniref:CRISPR-associated protein Csc2 n=1 Tax=Candidatus Methanoperedens nitratireducens TaxID=1392998 RepID=A0A284VT35_9EURY|nr:type I-D CRISPR-associated protein Cas7/Csc2 [Candidatus Methanoperedens nitroreducens]SNQ62358.1 CRISPR-associated protein Csc2 [Candidatus Methanoperedens nitroreducens]